MYYMYMYNVLLGHFLLVCRWYMYVHVYVHSQLKEPNKQKKPGQLSLHIRLFIKVSRTRAKVMYKTNHGADLSLQQ